MSSDTTPPNPGIFASTRWSVVLAAGTGNSRANPALGELCRLYWYPLYTFVRRQGHDAHDAQDLTQEFFLRLIENEWVAGVAPERGRFRSWLLASMRHFLMNEWHRLRAQKRGGGKVIFSLEGKDAESQYLQEPAIADAEQIYDRRWAITLIAGVVERLQTEMEAAGKTPQFDAMKPVLTGGTLVYAEVAGQLGMKEGAVRVAAHRLRERYRELLREAVADTVADDSEIEPELRHLFSALSM